MLVWDDNGEELLILILVQEIIVQVDGLKTLFLVTAFAEDHLMVQVVHLHNSLPMESVTKRCVVKQEDTKRAS